MDTEFSLDIITHSGVLCWHDANPKDKYLDVRIFLEEGLSLTALATQDDYIGGVAFWSQEIEEQIKTDTINKVDH